jgi:hypothetical protein
MSSISQIELLIFCYTVVIVDAAGYCSKYIGGSGVCCDAVEEGEAAVDQSLGVGF